MYAVVSYYNYRKNVSISILKTFRTLQNAKECAQNLAKEEYGEVIVEGVSDIYVDLEEELFSYTRGSGYDENVYSVVELPLPQD